MIYKYTLLKFLKILAFLSGSTKTLRIWLQCPQWAWRSAYSPGTWRWSRKCKRQLWLQRCSWNLQACRIYCWSWRIPCECPNKWAWNWQSGSCWCSHGSATSRRIWWRVWWWTWWGILSCVSYLQQLKL